VSEIHRCPNPECSKGNHLEAQCYESVTGHPDDDYYNVVCLNSSGLNGCGYRGPIVRGKRQAIRLHNALCRPTAPDDGKQAGDDKNGAMDAAVRVALQIENVLDRDGDKPLSTDNFNAICDILRAQAPDDRKGQPK
jgi:hypothetical protein